MGGGPDRGTDDDVLDVVSKAHGFQANGDVIRDIQRSSSGLGQVRDHHVADREQRHLYSEQGTGQEGWNRRRVG